jgi:TonB family protein
MPEARDQKRGRQPYIWGRMNRAIVAVGVVLVALTASPSIGQEPEGQPAPLRVGGDIRRPRMLKNPPPEYPLAARLQRLEGTVTLEITIGPTGLVQNVTVLRSVPGLDDAAVDAVRQWEFEPTTVRGEPIAVVATVDVPFSIGKRGSNRTERDLARAAMIFQDVRDSIDRLGPSRSSFGIDATANYSASLFLELAKAEGPAFPNLAADDATRAFRIAQTIPGSKSDVEDRQSNDRDVVSVALRWKDKTRIERSAIIVMVAVTATDRAVALARTGDIARNELYDALVLVVPAGQAVALANECRSSDGTYPYAGIAQRARMLGPLGEPLVRAGIAASESESSFAGRSDGVDFLQRTYDLVPPPIAIRALLGAVDRMLARPSIVPGRGGPDYLSLGPKVISILRAIDPNASNALAKAHPDWGPSSPPATNQPPPFLDRGQSLSLVIPPPMKRLARMSASEFERTLSETRKAALSTRSLETLIALGYMLVTDPPR